MRQIPWISAVVLLFVASCGAGVAPTGSNGGGLSITEAAESCASDDNARANAAVLMASAEADLGGSFRGITERAARKSGKPLDEYILQLWTEVLTVLPDGSITFQNAGAQIDSEVDTLVGKQSPLGMIILGANECFQTAIGLPERIDSQIGQTRALDGIQEASWGEFVARWNFHPVSGLTITYYLSES